MENLLYDRYGTGPSAFRVPRPTIQEIVTQARQNASWKILKILVTDVRTFEGRRLLGSIIPHLHEDDVVDLGITERFNQYPYDLALVSGEWPATALGLLVRPYPKVVITRDFGALTALKGRRICLNLIE